MRDVLRKLKMHSIASQIGGFVTVLILQVTFIVVFGIFVRYDDGLLPANNNNNQSFGSNGLENQHTASYPRTYFDYVYSLLKHDQRIFFSDVIKLKVPISVQKKKKMNGQCECVKTLKATISLIFVG